MLSRIAREFSCWFEALVVHAPGSVGNLLRRSWNRWHGALLGLRFGSEPGFRMTGHRGIQIGEDVSFGDACRLSAAQGQLKVGNRTKTNSGVVINADFGAISIGNDVLIAMNVIMRAADHRFDASPGVPISRQGHLSKPITIGNDVWIGAGAIILPGAQIGDHCVIGAGAVVKGEIPSNSVAVGVPARVIKQLGP